MPAEVVGKPNDSDGLQNVNSSARSGRSEGGVALQADPGRTGIIAALLIDEGAGIVGNSGEG